MSLCADASVTIVCFQQMSKVHIIVHKCNEASSMFRSRGTHTQPARHHHHHAHHSRLYHKQTKMMTVSSETDNHYMLIIVIRKFITRTQLSIKHESEARAVARWRDGVC